MKVIISKRLLGSQYEHHDGQALKEPTEPILGPSLEALKEHLSWSGLSQAGQLRLYNVSAPIVGKSIAAYFP